MVVEKRQKATAMFGSFAMHGRLYRCCTRFQKKKLSNHTSGGGIIQSTEKLNVVLSWK